MIPENKTSPTAIVLGGTSPHIELIRNLQARGFYVCLVDYLSNPPGAAVADEHIQESTLDPEKIIEIAKGKKAQLVISACIDQANSTCCYVAEKLDLPHPYSYLTSLDVTNKGRMKKIFAENGIPTSPFFVTQDSDFGDLNGISFPAVVKPVDCNSSKGVHRVDSIEETHNYVAQAIDLSRTNTAIIEEYNTGPEIQVDCLALNEGAEVIMTRQKKRIANGNDMVLQSSGSVIPAPLSEGLRKQVCDIAANIANAFQLRNTPFFYQAVIAEEGLRVLEFAPRIGGGLSYYLIKMVTGIDPIDTVIQSFLGEPIKAINQEQSKCYSTNLLYMTPGVFDHIEGLEELKNESVIKEYFINKAKGAVIDNDMRSGNRIGAFVVEGKNRDELSQKTETAFAQIEIFNQNGEKSLNRNILAQG